MDSEERGGASTRSRSQLLVRDVDVARGALLRIYGDVALDVAAGRREFEWATTPIEAGPITVLRSCSVGKIVLRGTPSSHVVNLATRRVAQVIAPGGSAEIARSRGAVVFSPGTRYEWRSPGRQKGVAICIDPAFLQGQIEALTGRSARAPVELAFTMRADSGAGASLERLCQLFAAEMERDGTLLDHSLIRTGLCEVVARALLLGQPNSYSALFEAPAPPSGPRTVRLVEEYGDAFAAGPIGAADLAALTGESGRSIAAGFRAHRGRTFDAFLDDKRLDLARQRLMESGTTTAGAAFACGFPDLRSFDAAYTRRFRESPAETHRRARAQLEPAPVSGPRSVGPVSATLPVAPRVLVMSSRSETASLLSRLVAGAGRAVTAVDSAQALLAASARASCAVVATGPEQCGLDVLAELAGVGCALPVVLLGEPGDGREAVRAMKAGAVDFLFAPVTKDELSAAVERAIALGAGARSASAEREALEARLATLTPREREVCERVARGMLNKQVAADLGISEARVKVHRANGMEKLGAESAAELGRLLERLERGA